MKKQNRIKKFVFIPLLILNLVVFNFPVVQVFAEEGETGDGQTEPVVENIDNGAGDSGGTVIDTGDVNVQVGAENEVNTNITETEEPVPPAEEVIKEILSNEPDLSFVIEPPLDENSDLTEATPAEETVLAEETPEECRCQQPPEPCEECQCDCKLEVDNENEAVVENNVEAEGDSGENIIEENSGDSVINTGDVNIAVGVLNTVNTNITESEFSNSLLNIFGELNGDINVEGQFETENSTLDNCQGNNECLEVNNQNSGEIDNNLLIDGSSGGNLAESTGGDATIKTGDVNVSASVFNLLNTNLIGSNWRNFIINVFDDWTGDLIFPGKEKMQEFLDNSSQESGCIGNCGVSVDNTNEGQIENEVSVVADTGDNTAVGDSTIIRTGGARATANVLNLANTNIVGGSWFFIAINHFGKWKGNLYSLPPGLASSSDDGSIKIYNMDADEFGNQAAGSSGGLEVVNDNTGVIKNSVIVNVSSGDNAAVADDGQAAIQTGDANVFTNLVNVLNTNLTNTNWLLGMVNVFGNWKGDVAFGRPDLLLAESAVVSANPVGPGGLITYTLNYFNNGDADATGVMIADDFDEGILSVTDAGAGRVKDNPGDVEWSIGTIPAGGIGSISYSAKISSDIPYGTTYAVNHSSINSLEEDWNAKDNIDTLSVEILRTLPDNSVPSNLGFLPYLQISKTSKQNVVKPGSNVDYEIILTNYVLGSAYEVVVKDVLYNESSEIINTYSWDLGEVRGYEKVVIDYTVAIGEEIPDGFYTNVAKALAWRGYDSNEASSTIEVSTTGISSLLETENTEPVEPIEPEPEISLDEIEKQLTEIGNNVKKIREEIKRSIIQEPEPVPESLVEQISEMLLPSVSAQGVAASGENTPASGEQVAVQNKMRGGIGLDKFLAAIGNIPFGLKLILIIAGVIILVLIFLWLFGRKKKEKE